MLARMGKPRLFFVLEKKDRLANKHLFCPEKTTYLEKYQLATAPAMVTCCEATINCQIQSPPKK